MCGIIAYNGKAQAEPFLIDGLRRLEYRGYDGFGYLVADDKGAWHTCKKIDVKLEDHVQQNFVGALGLAHTRWATHGKASLENTHPILCGRRKEHRFHNPYELTDYSKPPKLIDFICSPTIRPPSLAIVHNGIVENADEIKKALDSKYGFFSETDTEVLGNYIHWILTCNHMPDGSLLWLQNLVQSLQQNVKGEYACVFTAKEIPGLIVGIANGAPLLVTREGHIASDINALAGYAHKAWRLIKGDLVFITKQGTDIFGTTVMEDSTAEDVPESSGSDALLGHRYHMLKEIHQQSPLLRATLSVPPIEKPSKAFLFGCGSSWHAALVGKTYFEGIAGVPAEVEYASEMYHRFYNLQSQDTLYVALTQSGETKDTLTMMELLASKSKLLITNSLNSSAVRLAHNVVHTAAGLEVGVAATKTFTQQLLALLSIAKKYSTVEMAFDRELESLPAAVDEVLSREAELESLAKDISHYKNCLYLGRCMLYPIALEGALKMKEVAQVHAEGLPAAEIKHGPIALIDKDTLSIFLCGHQPGLGSQSIISNMSQVKSKGGLVLAICDKFSYGWASKFADYKFVVPFVTEYVQPILFNVPLQLLSAYVAIAKGFNVDRPRNLAKSVTV